MSHEATAIAWSITSAKHGNRLVLLSLADHHNGRTGKCFPSIPRLVEMTCLERKAVMRSVAALERLKLVRVERSNGRVSRYELLFLNQSQNGTGDPTGPVTKQTSTSPKVGRDRSQNVTRNQERTGKEPGKGISEATLEAERQGFAVDRSGADQNLVAVSLKLRERPLGSSFRDRDRWNQDLLATQAEIKQLAKLPAHHRKPDHQEKLDALKFRESELKLWLDGREVR